MKVLVVGSGGREHTLVWKIAQSPRVEKIYCAPGNAGIGQIAENVAIPVEDMTGITQFAKENEIDLVVVGPEDPLAMGLVDRLKEAGILAFGPSAKAARIEADKVFCKELMDRHGIPSAKFKVFGESVKAYEYLDMEPDKPVVVKAFGLAKGKGVYICPDRNAAKHAVQEIMDQKIFGKAGDRVVVEEMLEGPEASLMAFCDGKNLIPMVPAQDHKRIFDNDMGPNTGGMGCYSPVPVVTPDVYQIALEKILKPTLKAMEDEGSPYVGVLYAGIMLTKDGPKVLEFNCRFGDPETQVVLPRMKSDLVDVLVASAEGRLDEIKVDWYDYKAVCVVMASGGYPGSYEKGLPIEGLDKAGKMENVVVFHAGTAVKDSVIVTSGGRVLGVTGMGSDFQQAIDRAYAGVKKINFEGVHYRKDIGRKAIV